jgi:transposase
MAHLYKKVKKGHEYYYIRETQRVYGKPTTINQVYLGTADRVEAALRQGGFSPKEFGSVFILNELDRTLDLAGIVNEILPAKKKTKGPTLGELVFYAALNRAVAPTSKRRLASWYETTDIQRIRPLRLESLNSQNFWNHWDRISASDLDKISAAFFKKVYALLSPPETHLLVEMGNIYSTPGVHPAASLELEGDDTPAPSRQRVGLALVIERTAGVPLYYRTFGGGLPEDEFFQRHLDALLAKVSSLGVRAQQATLLLPPGFDSGAVIAKVDADPGLHFIASCSPDKVPELTVISLKEFSPLGPRSARRPGDSERDEDKILYYETQAPFWNKNRKAIIVFDPKTFNRSYQDLGKKVQRVRKAMLSLQQRSQQESFPPDAPQSIQEQLTHLCQRLKLDLTLFDLSFHEDNGSLRMDFQLNHRQMANKVRHFGKNILITDHEDWSAAEIFEVYTKRYLAGVEGDGAKSQEMGENPFQAALMPLYHWTGSKIRVHMFVCVVALTYLALVCQRLQGAGLKIPPMEVMEELRSLRTAIYSSEGEGKLKRVIEKASDTQIAILKALGYEVQDGKIQPLQAPLSP